MKKKLILEFENGLAPKYKKWTREAVEKFVSLFPEFKDNFEIFVDGGSSFLSHAEVENIVSRSVNQNISEQSVRDMFEVLPDGTYLRKNSVDWEILKASINGNVDLNRWLDLKKNGRSHILNTEPVRISIAARPTTFAYGISTLVGPCISAAQCGSDEAYFKDIVMHELGHTFNATHENRKNTVEQLGSHCTDADCLMYKEAYSQNAFKRRQALKQDNPFCADCMEAMRDFMERNLLMSRNDKSVNLQDLPMFKDISESELVSLDNYQRILREKNIQRTPQEQLYDMMSIFASARGGHNTEPEKGNNVIGPDDFLEATARTDWNDAGKLKILQGKIYSYKRYITYKEPFPITDMENPTPEIQAIEKAQLEQGKLARVKDEGYWIRKYGQSYFDNIKANPQKEIHRFILNVNPSEDLFQKLDNFAEKYGCQYKFPHLLSWNQRIDPVVIYTSDDRIAEQQKELIQIASPNVRRERMTNGLDGTRLADGIFMAKERDKADILALAQKAERNLPQLAQKLREEAQDARTHPLSLGEFLSYETIIDNANQAANNNFNVKLPVVDFNNSVMRGVYVIYNELKNKRPALANELDTITEKYEKNGITDWTAVSKDAKYQRIVGEFMKNTPVLQNPTYLDDTNLIEADFLKSYDDYLQKNQIQRSDESVFLDKMSLLAQMRRNYNYSNTYSDRYTQSGKYDFTNTAKTDWNNPESFKSLRVALYEAKKNVNYDTELFDKNKPATKNPDGTIPPYAVGGQTTKGDELAKVLIDDKDMEVKANLLSEQWIYRMPPNRGKDDFIKKPIIERFAINAKPDKNLITKLDAFAKKYKAYYKTATPALWHKRNDSVVIYCSEAQTPAMIDELKTIVSPYIRKSKPSRMNDLDGTLIANGLVTAKEPSKDSLKALFDELKTVNPQMAQALKNEIAGQVKTHPDNPLSLGQAEAYRLMLKSYRNFKNIPEQNIVKVSSEKLNEVNGGDRSFKKALREVFEPSARKEGSVYKEDIRASNYTAKITHQDGSIDHIEASSATNLSLSGSDKSGKAQLPDMQRFRDIAEYTHRKNTFVSFGNIKTPEFKARLMIACLEHEPPVAMHGQPKANKDFLDSLDAAVRKSLEEALYHAQEVKKTETQQKPEKQPLSEVKQALEPKPEVKPEAKPAPEVEPLPESTPMSEPKNNYEKSLNARMKVLDTKEKLGKITKTEKAELEDIKAQLLKQIELNKAREKFGDRDDPRFAEHEQKSGLKTKNYYYSPQQKRNPDWKLHLDIVPNRDDPTTKAISEFLEKLDVEHKIAHGGDNGKGMTIYVGNYADIVRLSREINQRFGDKIEKSPCYVDQALSEHYFNPKVSGRFYMQHIADMAQYPRSSIAGICSAGSSDMSDDKGRIKLFETAQKNGIIPSEEKYTRNSYGNASFREGNFHNLYVFNNLETYCSHKLYEKELGEFYCGKDVNKFEKDFFGDRLPEQGTPERAKWDKTAQEYVAFMEKEYPKKISSMKQEAQSYTSIDFGKLPPAPVRQQVKQGGRP